MSQHDSSKTPTTIKIAAKDASQRNTAGGNADPGPGDPSAAPSVAPQLVDIPEAPTSSQLVVKSTTGQTGLPSSAAGSVSAQRVPSTTIPPSASAQQPESIHDEDEEGEGEVEHPEEAASPSALPSRALSSPAASGPRSTTGPVKSAGIDSSPVSSAGGASKMSTRTGSRPPSASPAVIGGPSEPDKDKDKKKKKTTKFRYHKRIVVRTSGKTSPSAIMDKVTKKDHKAGITPSTIDDMDPQELMKRAGIKGTNKTHWRLRLRQTKRLTKDGKTTTQTKVAYRDSEGNKNVKTSSTPFCKDCGKKLEDCKCEGK